MKRSVMLFATVYFVIFTLTTIAPRGDAQVKYRNPLANSPAIHYWMNDWHTPYLTNMNLRYDGATISSVSPYYYGNNPRHRGTDFGASAGTAVYAGANGTVAYVNTGCTAGDLNCGGGFGNWVGILHSDGWYSIYAHLSSASVTQGSSISCGSLVGYSGNTGDSTAPHLHFELRYGLSSSDASRDPFAGSESQSTEYWYEHNLITDPLNSSNQIHYPTTACQQ